ncbi:TPA: hypothetical protein NV714_001695 [Escherichia coli]|nr:hypothetical protein [Escherichia coli]
MNNNPIFYIHRFIFAALDEELIPPYTLEKKEDICFYCANKKELIKSHSISKSWFPVNYNQLFINNSNNMGHNLLYTVNKFNDSDYNKFIYYIKSQSNYNLLYDRLKEIKKYKDYAVVSTFYGICSKCDAKKFNMIDLNFDYENESHLNLMIQRFLLYLYFNLLNFKKTIIKNMFLCQKNIFNYREHVLINSIDSILNNKIENNDYNIEIFDDNWKKIYSIEELRAIFLIYLKKALMLSSAEKLDIIRLYKKSSNDYYKNMYKYYSKILKDLNKNDATLFLKFIKKIKDKKLCSNIFLTDSIENIEFIGYNFCAEEGVFYVVLPYKKNSIIYMVIGIKENIEKVTIGKSEIKSFFSDKLKGGILYFKTD